MPASAQAWWNASRRLAGREGQAQARGFDPQIWAASAPQARAESTAPRRPPRVGTCAPMRGDLAADVDGDLFALVDGRSRVGLLPDDLVADAAGDPNGLHFQA